MVPKCRPCLGSLCNHKENGNKIVTNKINLRSFKFYGVYLAPSICQMEGNFLELISYWTISSFK